MNKLVEKLITNIICTTFFIFILYIQELNWVQNNSILLDSIVNLKKKKNKIIISALFTYNYTRAFFCRSKLDISMRILLPGNLTKKTASEKITSP
jgi:hypothetical protein